MGEREQPQDGHSKPLGPSLARGRGDREVPVLKTLRYLHSKATAVSQQPSTATQQDSFPYIYST